MYTEIKRNSKNSLRGWRDCLRDVRAARDGEKRLLWLTPLIFRQNFTFADNTASYAGFSKKSFCGDLK